MRSKALAKAQAKYDKKYRESGDRARKNKIYSIICSKENDKEVIEFLDNCPNKSGMVKDLIRGYMKRQKHND